MDAKTSAPAGLSGILEQFTNQTLTESTAYSSPQDTITISAALDNMSTISPYTVTAAIGTNFPNTIYTNGTGATTAPWMTSTMGQVSAPKIKLDGEGADIEVNGWSLVDAVKRIEERLGLFHPNPELEREWSDLHALADQYRQLEQHIKDKQATFDRLKAMPAPDID